MALQFSWAKLDSTDPGGPGWAVRATTYGGGGGPSTATGLAGQTVQVTAKSGKSKQVTLGRMLSQANGGRWTIYAVAAQESTTGSAKPMAKAPARQAATDIEVLERANTQLQARVERLENLVHALCDLSAHDDPDWTGRFDPRTVVDAQKVIHGSVEGRILNAQIAYERANGWSTD